MKNNRHQGVRAKKQLGQHFLKDKSVSEKIVQFVDCELTDVLLEIGPGTGSLTDFLINLPNDLILVDLDAESIEYLQEHEKYSDSKIIQGDFLALDLKKLTQKQIVIVGNFPYNISSQIVFKILDNRQQIPAMVGMFQKEVAKRICEKPGSKDYGILSVLVQSYFETEYLFEIPPSAFVPPPKVQSAVIRLKRKNTELDLSYSDLKAVTKIAFNQRRKTLSNALKSKGIKNKLTAEKYLAKRAEALSPEDFQDLTKILTSGI